MSKQANKFTDTKDLHGFFRQNITLPNVFSVLYFNYSAFNITTGIMFFYTSNRSVTSLTKPFMVNLNKRKLVLLILDGTDFKHRHLLSSSAISFRQAS